MPHNYIGIPSTGKWVVERMNRTISEILLKTIKNQEDWVQALPMVAFAHRSSEQALTTCIPMQSLIGRQPTLPIDSKMRGKDYVENDLIEEEVKAIEIDILCQNIDKLKKLRDEYILIGQSNIKKVQSRQKKAYDRRKNYVSDININDMVMRKLQKTVQRKGGKLEKKFAGPYKVVAKTVKGNCQLEDAKGKVPKTWFPINQLKKYLKRGDVGLESETSDDSDVDQDKNNGIKVQKHSQDSSVKRSGKYQHKILGSSPKRRKQNAMGPRDVTGSQDFAGSSSKQNTTGPRDVTGSQDFTGSSSKQNATGPRDVTGSQDFTGSSSKQNATGPRDVTGSQDFTGSSSKQNATGPRDVTGSQDFTGSSSKQNATGPRDVTGSQDFTGSSSKQNAMGSRDVTGSQDFTDKRNKQKRKHRENNKKKPPQKAARHSLSEEFNKINIAKDNKCKIIRDCEGEDPVFNPLSEGKREEIGIKVFGFMEYNENPPYEKVGRYMDGLPLKVKQIDKDGNCLFRAISYMLVGHEENYDKIRQKICSFIEEDHKDMKQFMDIDEKGNVIPGEVYVKNKGMRENKNWGTRGRLMHWAIMCKINVFVYYKQK